MENITHESVEVEEGFIEVHTFADFHLENGKVLKHRLVVECAICGQPLLPGSINYGEGCHIDGCD